jgi:outer membrane protein
MFTVLVSPRLWLALILTPLICTPAAAQLSPTNTSPTQQNLPEPAFPVPTGDKPMTVSPDSKRIASYLAGNSLSIDKAVAISLATNRSLAAAVSALFTSQGRTAEARAAFNPTVGLDAAITEFDAKTVVSFAGMSITTLNQFNPVFTTTASMPLDIMGDLKAAVSQNQFEEAAARIEVNRVRNSLVLDVKNAFYSVLRGQAQLNVAQDALNNATLRQETAQKSFNAGVSPRFDVIRAETDVANAQQGIIQARSALKLAMAVLKNTMGIDISIPIKITADGAVEIPQQSTAIEPPPATPKRNPPNAPVDIGALAPTEVDEPNILGPDYDAEIQEALKTRPEILEADASLAASLKGIRLARRSRDPRFALSLQYTLTPNNTLFSRENVYAATLDINIPIYDGGVSRAREKEARGDYGSAETAKRNAVDAVALDVQQAYLALLQAQQRVAVAAVGMVQAKESARLARVRYAAGVSQQVGVSPLLELSDSENSLSQAESNQVNALYDYNSARAQLDKAIGRYSFTTIGPGYTSTSAAKAAASAR